MFGGNSRSILEMGISGKISIALSYDILKELAGVLVGRKFRSPAPFVQQTIHELSEIAELVITTDHIDIIKSDPADNRVLECAAGAKADYIVSGDSDLLNLKQFRKIKILPPSGFLSLFD